MNSSPISPHPASGRTDSSLVVCSTTSGTQNNNIQDIHSSHSQTSGDRNQAQRSLAAISSSSANNNYENKQHDNNTTTRMNLNKTEYKSNFTPFDQYVYNEVTDTFVKQQQQHCKNAAVAPSNNLLIESRNNHPLSASSSNHDLSGNTVAHGVDTHQHHSMMSHAAGALSPAGLETGLFEPPANGTEHHDATSEPWYMEVMKRNEKAHEYRFKSEIGHNSPLLKSGPSNEDLIRKSPLGSDPLTEAQIHEQQQLAAGTLDSITGNSKQTFRFSPHDYKRDHLIAHMANNNNFKLPKDATNETPASRLSSTRRVPITQTNASSRPLSRTTAASRARSQSSRRQVAGATGVASPTKAASTTTKSNQTTPVKSVPSRVSTTTARPPAGTSLTKTTTTTTARTRPTTATTRVSAAKTPLGSSQNGTTRPTTAAPAARRPLTTTTTTKTTPLRSATTTTTTTTTNSRPTAASSTRAPASTRPTAPVRTVARTTTTTTSTSAPKSPVKRVGTTSTTSRPTTARQSPLTSSRSSSTRGSASKTPATSSEPSPNAVKSIKTKALVDAGQKAAAVAASAALVTAATAAAADTSTQDSESKPTAPELVSADINITRQELPERETLANVFDDVTIATHQPVLSNYMTSEPDLIFTTTEGGNMLADEIAQAERAASENLMREQMMTRNEVQVTAQPIAEPESNKSAPESETSELVNGLAGGLVSTEDRYDSSERDGSLDGFAAQQAGQANNQQGMSSNDDEPYSIIPTTYDSGKHNDQCEVASDDKQQQQLQLQPVTQQPIEEAENVNTSEPQVELLDQKHVSELESNNLIDDSKGEVNALDHARSKRSLDIAELDEQVDKREDAQPVGGADQQESEPRYASIELDTTRQENEADIDGNKEALLTDDIISSSRKMSSPGDSEDKAKEVLAESSEPEEGFMAESDDEPLHFSKSEDDKFDRNLSRDDLTTEMDILDDQGKTSPTHDDILVKNSANDLSGAEQHEESAIAPDAIGFHRNDTIERVESALVNDDMGKQDSEERELVQEQQVLSDQSEQFEQQPGENIDAPAEMQQADDVNTQQKSDQYAGDTQARDEQQTLTTSNDGATQQANAEPKLVDEFENEAEGDSKGELLMNVADLMEIETIKKQEMSKKAEAAREQSNSRGSLNLLQVGEILLSPDQLNERFSQFSVEDKPIVEDASQSEKQAQGADSKIDVDLDDDDDDENQAPGSHDVELLHAADQEANLQQTEKSPDLLNFGSITSSNHDNQLVGSDAGAQRFDTFEIGKSSNDEEGEPAQEDVTNLHENLMMGSEDKSENLDINLEADSTRATKSTTSVNDEVELEEDEEEQQKLSNHLTNSDDDVILEPRNIKKESLSEEFDANTNLNISPSRYNEGAGLSLLAREERMGEKETTTELADGLSAEIVAPTVAENRVEVATSKFMMPELSQAATFIQAPKLTQEDDSDGDDLELNPNADPIDVAATMSPSSSVAEEMLRLSRQASSGGVITLDQLEDHNVGLTNVDSPKHDHVTSGNKQADDESCKELSDLVDRGTNLLAFSTESLSSQKELAQVLANETIDDTLQKLVAESSPPVVSLNVDPINNNEITSDSNSASRKQNVDRNGDSVSAETVVQSGDASGLVKEEEDEEESSESVDRTGNPGMINGAAANDNTAKVTVPTD